MAPLQGRVATVEVQTAVGPPAVYTLLGETTTYGDDSTRENTQTSVLGSATKRSAVGNSASTLTATVLAEIADAGQVAVNTAYDSGAYIVLRIRPDGAVGWTASYLVSGRRYSGTAENGFQTVEYTFVQDGAETKEVGGVKL